MARYKNYDLNQTKMIPLSYADKIVEGSFEFALNEVVEEQLDLSVFEHRNRNDATRRSANDPKVQRQLTIIKHTDEPRPRPRPSRCNDAANRMRWKCDTPLGRAIYSRRMGTLLFAHLTQEATGKSVSSPLSFKMTVTQSELKLPPTTGIDTHCRRSSPKRKPNRLPNLEFAELFDEVSAK